MTHFTIEGSIFSDFSLLLFQKVLSFKFVILLGLFQLSFIRCHQFVDTSSFSLDIWIDKWYLIFNEVFINWFPWIHKTALIKDIQKLGFILFSYWILTWLWIPSIFEIWLVWIVFVKVAVIDWLLQFLVFVIDTCVHAWVTL